MIERIETAFKSYRSVMVQMPTGTGKTILLAEVVKSEKLKASEEKSEKIKGKNPCVWIVVHRRELVEQIKETLAKQLDSSSSLFPLHLPRGFSPSSGYLVIIMSWMSVLR